MLSSTLNRSHHRLLQRDTVHECDLFRKTLLHRNRSLQMGRWPASRGRRWSRGRFVGGLRPQHLRVCRR